MTKKKTNYAIRIDCNTISRLYFKSEADMWEYFYKRVNNPRHIYFTADFIVNNKVIATWGGDSLKVF